MAIYPGYEQTDDRYYLNNLARKVQAEHDNAIVDITENGTYDVASYKKANVDVSGGGGGSSVLITNATYDSVSEHYYLDKTFGELYDAYEQGSRILIKREEVSGDDNPDYMYLGFQEITGISFELEVYNNTESWTGYLTTYDGYSVGTKNTKEALFNTYPYY